MMTLQTNYMEIVKQVYCTDCEQAVQVGYTSRDTWYGMCDCTAETLPKIRPEIDFERNYVDQTGEIDWPYESWEARDNLQGGN